MENVAVAKLYVSRIPCQIAAIQILATSGGKSQIDLLLNVAARSYGDVQVAALRAIETLSTGDLSRAKSLLQAKESILRRLGFSIVKDSTDAAGIQLLEDLLANDDENLRVGAIAELRHRLARAELEALLGRYTDRSHYFYNVVTWLDRLLYAPSPVLPYFEVQLKQKLKALTI